jgi:hypothetical protein
MKKISLLKVRFLIWESEEKAVITAEQTVKSATQTWKLKSLETQNKYLPCINEKNKEAYIYVNMRLKHWKAM